VRKNRQEENTVSYDRIYEVGQEEARKKERRSRGKDRERESES
jgi:hypothetical protein